MDEEIKDGDEIKLRVSATLDDNGLKINSVERRPFANLPYRHYAYGMGIIAGIGAMILLNIILVFFVNFFVFIGIGSHGYYHPIIVIVVQLFMLQQSYFVAKDQFYSTIGTYQKFEWDCLKPDTPIQDVEAIFFTACSTLIEKCYSKEEIIDMIKTQY